MAIILLFIGLGTAAMLWHRHLWPAVREPAVRADVWAKWWSFGCAVTLLAAILMIALVG